MLSCIVILLSAILLAIPMGEWCKKVMNQEIPFIQKSEHKILKVPAHFFKRNELEAILRFDLGFLAPLVYRLVPHPSCQWDGSLDGLQYHVFVYHQHELAIV